MKHVLARTGAPQRGVALPAVMLMLVVILLLATVAARTSMLGEKAARNDRDRLLALHAAEAALRDAESDLKNAVAGPRHAFLSGQDEGALAPGTCGSGAANPLLGLCLASEGDAIPAWRGVDFEDQAGTASSVPYGYFTAAAFVAPGGTLPRRPPRYLIEVLKGVTGQEGRPTRMYRVTALGFGALDASRVALQAWYRRRPGGNAAAALALQSLNWREITEWSEVHATHGQH